MFIIYARRKSVDFYNGTEVEERDLPKFKDLLWPYHTNPGYAVLEAI